MKLQMNLFLHMKVQLKVHRKVHEGWGPMFFLHHIIPSLLVPYFVCYLDLACTTHLLELPLLLWCPGGRPRARVWCEESEGGAGWRGGGPGGTVWGEGFTIEVNYIVS